MRQFLIEFLKEIERLIPPPQNCHHALTFARYGNDDAGWQDRLALQVNTGGVFVCLFIDEGDFEKGGKPLAAEVADWVNAPGDFQRGVGFGQYAALENSNDPSKT